MTSILFSDIMVFAVFALTVVSTVVSGVAWTKEKKDGVFLGVLIPVSLWFILALFNGLFQFLYKTLGVV